MINFDFGNAKDYTKLLKEIRRWAKSLRQLRPTVESTWREPVDWIVKDANINGRPVKSLTITLTPTGCSWASGGGCTMCGEFEGSTKSSIVSAEFHIAQFASAVSKYVTKYHPAWLRIYQEGNYTNSDEIESSAQLTILKLAGLLGGVERITIESLAKYITPEIVAKLNEARNPNVELEIGMGFEGENEIVRNICVNKGENIDDFHKAVRLLKKMGIRSLAYVLLKPPFLSEGEAIEEAISTIQVANEIGFDAVSLEPASIHRHTLLHALNLEGFYQLPWLWSVIKVAMSARNIRDFRIGGVGFYPRPINVAHNRHPAGISGCNEILWAAIKEYGKSRNFAIFEGLDCACKKDWEETCRMPSTSLLTRVDQQLKGLDLERYKRFISEEQLICQPAVGYATAEAGGTQYLYTRPETM